MSTTVWAMLAWVAFLSAGLGAAVVLGRMITARDVQRPWSVFDSDEVAFSILAALDDADFDVAAVLVDYLHRRDPARAAPLRARLVLSDERAD